MEAALHCPECGAVLPLSAYNSEEMPACSGCGSPVQALVFPAFLKNAAPVWAEHLADDSEASCFYHPLKRAVLACQRCGRFVCALCEVELSGEHLCPQCLESGQRKGKLVNLEKNRTLYENIGLMAALLPILTLWGVIFGAPATFYLFFRHRKSPRSLVRRGRWKWPVALTIATLEIAMICVGVVAIRTAMGRQGQSNFKTSKAVHANH